MKSARDRPAPHAHTCDMRMHLNMRKGSATPHSTRNFTDSRRYEQFIPASEANLKTTRDLEGPLCIGNYLIHVWIVCCNYKLLCHVSSNITQAALVYELVL